jgi:hypothetical protein
VQEDEANIQHRTGASSRSIAAGSASLLRGGTASEQIGRIGTFSIRPSWLTASFGHSLIRTRVSGIGQAS